MILDIALSIQAIVERIEKVLEDQIFETKGLLASGYLLNQVLIDTSNKALFEGYLSRLLKLLLHIAVDDLNNFRALTLGPEAPLALMVKFVSKTPSVFRKTLCDILNQDFDCNEIGFYESLREVFGDTLTKSIFLPKILNLEYQNGLVSAKIKEMLESSGHLCTLLATYCMEDNRFYMVFSEQYRAKVRSEVEKRGRGVMAVILEMF